MVFFVLPPCKFSWTDSSRAQHTQTDILWFILFSFYDCVIFLELHPIPLASGSDHNLFKSAFKNIRIKPRWNRVRLHQYQSNLLVRELTNKGGKIWEVSELIIVFHCNEWDGAWPHLKQDWQIHSAWLRAKLWSPGLSNMFFIFIKLRWDGLHSSQIKQEDRESRGGAQYRLDWIFLIYPKNYNNYNISHCSYRSD